MDENFNNAHKKPENCQLNLIPATESALDGFLSNLQCLLFSPHPLPVRKDTSGNTLILSTDQWYQTILGNLKAVLFSVRQPQVTAKPSADQAFFSETPRAKIFFENLSFLLAKSVPLKGVTAKPVETDLLLDNRPWYRTLYEQLRQLSFRRTARVYLMTARPVQVEEVFKNYKFRRQSAVFSVAAHVLFLGLLLWVQGRPPGIKPSNASSENVTILTQSPLYYRPVTLSGKSGGGGGGGGGRRESTPASLGRLPKLSSNQLTPPTPKIVNPNPVLPVEPTITVPDAALSQLPSVNLHNLGDPMGVIGPPSSGPGQGGGIGKGTGGGVGSGNGAGYGPGEGGGVGGGIYRVGGGVIAPRVLYRVDPLYSEEARKARYQGTVLLSAIVRKDGTIEILRIVRGLGLGLDENAIAALKQWKFQPGVKSGEPVDVALNIEVNFSLR